MIFEYITTKEQDGKRMFYIDVPESTGKTFLYKALILYFSSIGKKVLPMAWTGIASILLPKRVTSHKTFKLPFDLTSTETSFLKLDSHKRESDVIVWDEASIIPKTALEIVDKTLRNVCNIDHLPFTEKLIIRGEDCRQIL